MTTCPGACDFLWLDTDVDEHDRHVDLYRCRTCGDLAEKTRDHAPHRPVTPASPNERT